MFGTLLAVPRINWVVSNARLMPNLIPHFIHQQFSRGIWSGAFSAATLFVDLVGFTRLTESLMLHARDGAEVLSDALAELFAPLVQVVHGQAGIIPRFAGDAFTAIFSCERGRDGEQAALQTAFVIQQHFGASGRTISTPYGDFTISVKIGCSFGEVQWGIPGQAGLYDFYFRGPAVDGCAHAETIATQGDIIADGRLLPRIQAYTTSQPLAEPFYHRLLAATLPHERTPLPAAPPVELSYTELAPFVPESILELPVCAEFREICALFFSFAEPADQESLHHFLAEAMTTSRAYGGYLNQIDFGDQGGLLVLLFGAPLAFEQNVLCAAEFLLTMQHKAGAIHWRAGVTFGTVWAGVRGGVERSEYGAVGDVMNLASRMAMTAPWGEIWLTQAVYTQLQAGYQVESLGERHFKGKGQPQPIYRLLGKGPPRRPPAPPSGLVGRSAELRQLCDWVEPIFAGRWRGILYVYGEAGMGKSRLLHALRRQLGQERPLRWLHCPTDSMLRQSLNPFRSMLRHYFCQSSEQDAQQNRRCFEQQMDRLLQNLAHGPCLPTALRQELVRTRSFLAALVGLHQPGSLYEQVEPQLRFENMLAALKNLIWAEANLQPVLLEMEDIHWLDDDSQRLLQFLTRNLTDLPLAILCTARYDDRGAPVRLPVDEAVPQQQIELGYWQLAGVQQYAEQLLQAKVSESAAVTLLEKSGGNPFFVEQLIEDLRARQLFTLGVGEEGPTYTLQPFDATSAPATLSGLLVARLDRLGVQTKQVVQTAAVLGHEFSLPVLAKMLHDRETLSQQLALAEQEQIWSAVTPVRYLFRHALLRDAAYDMQLRTRLRTLHRQAAGAIEQVHLHDLPDHYADVAFHYDQAAATPEAAYWYELAGEQAVSRYANTEALRYLTRALALTPASDWMTRYRLLLGREGVYHWLAERDQQKVELAALASLPLTQAPAHAATVALRRARYARMTGEYSDALAAVQEAIAHATATHQPALEIEAYHTWGRILTQQGDYPLARAKLEQTLQLAWRTANAQYEALALYNLGGLAYYTGDFATALVDGHEALQLYQQIGDRRGAFDCLTLFGSIHQESGEYDLALSDYQQALAISREVGLRYGESLALGCLGNAYFNLGDYATARRYHQQALQACRASQDREGEAISLDTLGLIQHSLGDDESAQLCYQQALHIQQAIGDRRGAAFTLTHWGHAALAHHELANAATRLQQAFALHRQIGEQSTLIDSLAGLASLALYKGQIDRATAYVNEILTWLDQHGVHGVEFPIQVYLICHRVLNAGCDPNHSYRATQVIQSARQLLQQRAQAIQDESLRTTFLTNVRAHRELRDLGLGE
jgi:predicted ATPase/class 3 adenylate cyclase